jgi:hypothetical protein
MPWLVDVYRAARKPEWEYSLWRDYETTRRAARGIRQHQPTGAEAPAVLVALYRDDVFDTKIGLLLATTLQPHGLRTVVYAPSRRARRVARYARAFGTSEVVFADELPLADAARRAVDERAHALLDGPCDFDSVKSWHDGARQIGNHVLSTLIRLTFDGSPDLAVDANRALLGSVLRDVLANYARADALFDRIDIAAVLVEEANYSVNGPLVDVAVERGVDVVQTITTWRDDALISKRLTEANRREDAKSVARESYDQLSSVPWTRADDQELDDDFARRYGKAWGMGQQFQPVQAGSRTDAEIVEEIGLDPSKPTAVIFAHVLWDASLFFGVDLFQNYAEWMVETVRRALGNDRLNWVVKAHPSNVFRAAHGDVEGECSELVLLRDSFRDLPPHVFVLRPDTNISTVSLYRFADAGITVRGTPGLEMACFGKTVLTAGTGAYSGLGFTVDSSSTSEYLGRLDVLETLPAPTRHATERARRYAHALFVERPWVPESFEMAFKFPERGWNPLDRNVRLGVDGARALIQGPDARRWRDWVVADRTPDFFGQPRSSVRGVEQVIRGE